MFEIIGIAIVVLLLAVAVYAHAHHLTLKSILAKLEGKTSAAPPAGDVGVTTSGDVTVIHYGNSGTTTPPTPPTPVVPTPGHGGTPPANAGSTGSLVGQPVPGGDTPDANGAIAIPAIASKFAPGSRFLTVASLPYVPEKSAAAFCIAANCGNTSAAEQITGLASVVALAVVANPAETVAFGGPAFHLAGQAPGEKREVIANVISLSSKFSSVADIVAKYQNAPDYGTGAGSGSGFSPGH